jgi:CRP-like cAMP-binding protein
MQSVLGNRLKKLGLLKFDHEAIIRKLEAKSNRVLKRQTLCNEGDTVDAVYILKSGWAAARCCIGDKRPTLIRLYLPGDIVGLNEFDTGVHPFEVMMLSDGSVAKVSGSTMEQITQTNPSLMSALSYFDRLDNIAMHDQLYAMTRFSAADRIKQFFLNLHARLQNSLAMDTDRIPFYMQKNELADLNGMSAVTVSYILTALRQEGSLVIKKDCAELRQRKAWAEELDFINRYGVPYRGETRAETLGRKAAGIEDSDLSKGQAAE